MKKITPLLISLSFLLSCTHRPSSPDIILLEKSSFSTLLNGEEISLFTISNKHGMTAQFTNYGARIVSLWVSDKDGLFRDVVWGLPSIEAYLSASDRYGGPIVGRYGNRIGKGGFQIGENIYQLTLNEGENHLHGGANGWSTCVWSAVEDVDSEGNPCVIMNYLSPNGEEGYPGNVDITVKYTLTPDNELRIEYSAQTDLPTIINPTSHAYFNLHGTSEHSTNSHLLMINADSFTPTDEGLIPTGEICPVEGTPMDFRELTAIGARAEVDYEALRIGGGYDHNWVLNRSENESISLAAKLYEPSTGITMLIYTDQPGLQFYGGQGMNGKDVDKYGVPHNRYTGIALETQNFPDAPNHANFPSALLLPGEIYNQRTVYRFE